MLQIKHTNQYILGAYLICLISGSFLVWNYSYQTLQTEHKAQLDRFSSHISTKLDKYAHLPQLLAKNRELIALIQHPNNSAQREITNRFLTNVNTVIQAADTYLIDATGETIAASNWDLERTFIGKNFAWRPYFSEAMQGQSSQYFALGSTSGARGYYYSYPVIYAAEVIGVIVIKMDLSSIEENWSNKNSFFVATDLHNVIFMSSNPNWLFRSLTTLSEAQRADIRSRRQYLDKPLRSLGLQGNLEGIHAELKSPHKAGLQGDFVVSTRPLNNLKLNIRILTPKVTILWSTLRFALLLTLIFAIAYLSAQLVLQRQTRKRQIEQLQSEANQKLEFLVMERTAELHAEILERSKTEQILRKTQDELIQAAKLAVLGQLSASISHELNNPLAAIRSFSDNARRFLAKQQLERVDDNLNRISGLTERMAKISDQLKSFARKSDTKDRCNITLVPIIQSAKTLVEPQLKANNVTLTLECDNHTTLVNINTIQFEQVLINLLTNSIQALEEQAERIITITTITHSNQVSVHIDDNGPGVSKEKAEQLFEPFFTTKKNGLGLGLSISQQIIQAMNGSLMLESSPLGGARFTIVLPISVLPINTAHSIKERQ